MGKKQILDKFYTKSEIAKYFIQKIDLSLYKNIIDPCAGAGAFSDQIENCLAFDIVPENENIKQLDFFNFQENELEHPILTISNVPFGVQSNLAISFFKKASTYSDTIAFILPKSFKKESIQNKLPLNFHLDYEEDVPDNSFTLNGIVYNVPCVFQIWNKKDFIRTIDKKIPTTDLFSFTKKEEANVSIRRVGIFAGKAFITNDKSKQSHYFIKTNIDANDFIKKINKIKWEHNNTVGPKSISKKELIIEIIKNFRS